MEVNPLFNPAAFQPEINKLIEEAKSEAQATRHRAESTDMWLEEPVDILTFCNEFIGEGLFDGPQSDSAMDITGKHNTKEWPDHIRRAYLFWGKGSGKDRTSAKIITYVAYKLKCMNNPQKYFGLGLNAPIDIINIATTGAQAKNVFFDKNLKPIVELVKDPKTRNNWFEDRGVQIKKGYAFKFNIIDFNNNITAHSLNFERWSSEGLSILYAICDEIGAWKPDKGLDIIEAIEDSMISRFADKCKLLFLSYKYNKNCLMSYLFNNAEAENNKLIAEKKPAKAYLSRAKTWEVHLRKNKEIFADKYIKNASKAIYTYECRELKDVADSDDFIKIKHRIYDAVRGVDNPFKNGEQVLNSLRLKNVEFNPSFKPNPNSKYYIHIDGAKGGKDKQGKSRDVCGFVMCHKQIMKPYYSDEYLDYLKRNEVQFDFNNAYIDREGVVADILLQIQAPNETNEIELEDIRGFVYRLHDMGFNVECTFDGWESLDSRQQMKKKGVNAELLSVDSKREPYENLQDLLYNGLLKMYHHKALIRELEELIDNEKGKIDHPEISIKRQEEEGDERGSKDVADGLAGSSMRAAKSKIGSEHAIL